MRRSRVDCYDDDEIIELTMCLTGKSIRALEDVARTKRASLADAANMAIQVFAHLDMEVVVGGQFLFLYTPGEQHLSQVRWHSPDPHPSG